MVYPQNEILYNSHKEKLQGHRVIWVSITKTMLSERIQTQKSTYCIFQLYKVQKQIKLNFVGRYQDFSYPEDMRNERQGGQVGF